MRIGRYSVPAIRIHPTLVEAVRRLYNKFQSSEVRDLNEVATTLNHKSARSGAFLLKLTALRAYGLIEGRGRIYVTDLGAALAYPRDRSEEERAFERAFKNIPLWQELYTRFGADLPKQNFAEELAKITGASVEESKAKEAWIRSAYQDDILHITATQASKDEAPPRQESREEQFIDFIELSAGRIHLRLPFSKEGVEALESALAILKKKLQSAGQN